MFFKINKYIRENPMLAGLFLLSIVLYCQQSWVPGFFHDGYLYAAFGKNAALGRGWLVPHGSDLVYNKFFHHTPTVFILEGLFFKLFGASYTTARIFSASFSILTLSLIVYWLRSCGEKKWAYLSGVFFLCLPALLKKTRFPSIDPALMLFILSSLFFYWKALANGNLKNWLLSGAFFGVCLLVKGPMAAIVLIAMTIHLILTKNVKLLLSYKPWLGLLFGFMVFSTWPIALKLTGNIDIFYKYLSFIFLDTIKDARGEASPFYVYFLFLLKTSGPWLLLTLVTIYNYCRRVKQHELVTLFLALFLAVLIPLSFASFKYSHYIIPLYPALAILASYPLLKFSEKFFKRFQESFLVLSILVTLVLLVFPVTNKSKRDPEIFKVRTVVEMLKEAPRNWVIVDGIYPFWSLNNMNSWIDHSNTYSITKNELLNWIAINKTNKNIILVHQHIYESLKSELSKNYKPLMHFTKRNMIILFDKKLLSGETDYLIK